MYSMLENSCHLLKPLFTFVISRENSSLEEIVEKQGDVIEYLQRHNALLSKRLLALTSQQMKT